MQCKEWDDANSELFKESHDEAVHKNSYKSRLYELISASLNTSRQEGAALELPLWYLQYHHPAPLGCVSLDFQSPRGSLRLKFPCHQKRWDNRWRSAG